MAQEFSSDMTRQNGKRAVGNFDPTKTDETACIKTLNKIVVILLNSEKTRLHGVCIETELSGLSLL
jgi:hypothetical protein